MRSTSLSKPTRGPTTRLGASSRPTARDNLLVLRGWRVLRFTWEQVMHQQAYVRWALAELRRVERDEGESDPALSA